MKLFQCQNCGQPLYFENTRCERCGLALGYLPELETITALKPDGRCANTHHRRSGGRSPTMKPIAYCANAAVRRLQLAGPGMRPKTLIAPPAATTA